MDFQGVIRTLASLSVWFIVLSIVFAPLEKIWGVHRQKYYRNSFAADVAYYLLSSMTPKLILALPVSLLAALVHRYQPAAIYAWTASLPTALRAIAALVVGEIGVYWGHRWMHEIPFLWRFHAVHHSAEEMDWLVNSRAHPVDLILTRLCGIVPMYLLGLAQPSANQLDWVPMLTLFVGTTWGFFVHANLNWRFGPLEWVVATPAFHHWHHTNDGVEVQNKNYATLLPILDKCFGTFYLPKQQWPAKYGIDEPQPENVAVQLLNPILSAARGHITSMIWILSALLIFAATLSAQESMVSIPSGPHFHFVPKGGCKGQPDKVNMKSGNTYYACIQGKSACSEDQYFPSTLIVEFDRRMKEIKEQSEARIAESERFSQQVREKIAASQAQMNARVAAARTTQPRSYSTQGGVVEAAPPAPAAAKVSAEKLAAITEGVDREALLRQLGPPYMKISGDSETFTYQLEAGGIVRILIEAGKVTKIRVITP